MMNFSTLFKLAISLGFAMAGRLGKARPGDCGATDDPSELGYFCGANYDAQTHEAKLNELWTQCIADETPQEIPFTEIHTQLSSTEFKGNQSFNTKSDEMPRNRVKVLHAQGVVAKVEWFDLGNH